MSADVFYLLFSGIVKRQNFIAKQTSLTWCLHTTMNFNYKLKTTKFRISKLLEMKLKYGRKIQFLETSARDTRRAQHMRRYGEEERHKTLVHEEPSTRRGPAVIRAR